MLSSFRQSFRNSRKAKSTPVQISKPVEIPKKKLNLDNIVFITLETYENELLESFFKQLIASMLEKKESKERNEAKYKGLGYIAFLSYVFFNSSLRADITLVDSSKKTIDFKLDITKTNFSQSSLITNDCIDNFVAGEERDGKQIFTHSIRHQYPKASFPKEVSSPNSIDWATFRIEINEVIFRIFELSKKDIETMIQIGLDGPISRELNDLEKIEKIKEISEIIVIQRDRLRTAALGSKTYWQYQASHPITEQALKQRYRQSQFFEIGLGKKIPIVNTVEMEMGKHEEPNNNSFGPA